MKKVIIISFLIFILTVPVKAEDTSIKKEAVIEKNTVLTLEQCINIAINKNPNITFYNNVSKIYQSRIGQAKAAYFPQINLSTGYSRQNPATSSNLDNTANQYSGSIGLNQLLFDFGKTPAKVKIQGLNLDASRFDTENTIIQISYNVKQGYYSALSAKISKDIYAQSIKLYEQHLRRAKSFYEIGTKSKIDITTAEVNLSNAKLSYIKAGNVYQTSIANLNNAMGVPDISGYDVVDKFDFKRLESKPANNEIEISNKNNSIKKSDKDNKQSVLKSQVSKFDIIENLTFKKNDVNFEEALKKAYENRPDLKSLMSKESASNESVKLAKKDYLPNLSGFANYGLGGQEFPLDTGWSLGANITMPVFNGFLTKNQINEAKANFNITASNIEILKQNIYLQVQQAYINLTEAEKRIPVSNLIVKQAKENLELATGRYNVGVGNSVEVQDAGINYNNAQLSYVQALYDYSIASSNLEKAIGVK